MICGLGWLQDYESLFISMMMIMLSVLLDIVVLSVFGPWDCE